MHARRRRLLIWSALAVAATVAAAAVLALTGVSAATSAKARELSVDDSDRLLVAGSGVTCLVRPPRPTHARALVCWLPGKPNGPPLRQSRIVAISDEHVAIRLAATERALFRQTMLYRERQPSVTATAPFPEQPDRPDELRLKSGQRVSIGGTHILCIDIAATLTCTIVNTSTLSVPPLSLGVTLTPTSVLVVQASHDNLDPVAWWPLIGGR